MIIPIGIGLIIFGFGFVLLDKILSGLIQFIQIKFFKKIILFQRADMLSSMIDATISKITGKSIVLHILVTFGLMFGAFWLAIKLDYPNTVLGLMFGVIGFTLLGYIFSARYR